MAASDRVGRSVSGAVARLRYSFEIMGVLLKQSLCLGAASALAVMVGFSVGANASAVINGITVTDSGLANPLSPDVPQPTAYSVTGAQVQFAWTGGGLTNQGWDPFGPDDKSHHWWNIGNGGGSVGFNLSGNVLNIVWGSPNDDNTVKFYSGANASGNVVGAVTNPDLISAFGVGNFDQPGYLISFNTPKAFESVVFSTGPTSFEFAVTAVPGPVVGAGLPGLMLLAGAGLLGWRRRKPKATAQAVA
jgi:hypothetical protein